MSTTWGASPVAQRLQSLDEHAQVHHTGRVVLSDGLRLPGHVRPWKASAHPRPRRMLRRAAARSGSMVMEVALNFTCTSMPIHVKVSWLVQSTLVTLPVSGSVFSLIDVRLELCSGPVGLAADLLCASIFCFFLGLVRGPTGAWECRQRLGPASALPAAAASAVSASCRAPRSDSRGPPVGTCG